MLHRSQAGVLFPADIPFEWGTIGNWGLIVLFEHGPSFPNKNDVANATLVLEKATNFFKKNEHNFTFFHEIHEGGQNPRDGGPKNSRNCERVHSKPPPR